ncbi:hypothetical protein BSKO_09925 [Bryopsis sp. KO-2023]|nr:hypothetical protein BSKO_09925 [Bryopsis sp. KO-2023]
MAATANVFGELEHIGSLEPFATRREFLDQLKLSGEMKREEEKEEEESVAADPPGALSTKAGKFSDAEIDSFKSDGWTVVQRSRPPAPSLSDEPSDEASDDPSDAVVVVPREMPTIVPAPDTYETPITSPPEKHTWKFVRWGAIGVLGAVALAKLACRK